MDKYIKMTTIPPFLQKEIELEKKRASERAIVQNTIKQKEQQEKQEKQRQEQENSILQNTIKQKEQQEKQEKKRQEQNLLYSELEKELSVMESAYNKQNTTVTDMKKGLDDLLKQLNNMEGSTKVIFTNEYNKEKTKYLVEVTKLNELTKKIQQIKMEITQLTQPKPVQPVQPSPEDDYNRQLNIVNNLKKAKDALAHDPNSVAQEAKLEEYQKKYSEAIQKLNDINKTLQDIYQRTETDINETSESIKNYRDTLNDNQQLFDHYSNDIKSKMSLVATRDRMLQLSQERNVYKKKVIYVLISIVIALIIAVVASQTFYGKMTS